MVKATTPRPVEDRRPRRSSARFIVVATTLTATMSLACFPRAPVSAQAGGSVAETCVPVRVMPLGDSLTAGGAGHPQFYDSYRYGLWSLMRAADLPVEFVGDQNGVGGVATNPPPDSGLAPGTFAHSGHGGWTISQVSDVVEDWVSAARPEVVLVNLGTNYEPGGAAKLTALVAKIRKAAPNAVVVTSSLTPFRGELTSTWVDPERKALGEAAAATGDASPSDRVLYADIRTRLMKGTGGVSAPFGPADYNQLDTNDEVHLSPAGGVKFAQAWFPEVRDAIRSIRPLPCQGKQGNPAGGTPSPAATNAPVTTRTAVTTKPKPKPKPKAKPKPKKRPTVTTRVTTR